MKYLIFILSLLSFLVATVLLVIAISSCAPDVHAEIRVEWIPLPGTESLKHVNALETDEFRLYAGGSNGIYLSLDNGYTWRLTDLTHSIWTIAIDGSTVYAGTYDHGIFRSDNRGITWKPINNGLRTSTTKKGRIIYPYIEQMLVTNSGTVIAVGYHSGTHTSTNRGDTWHDVFDEWVVGNYKFGREIRSMTELDSYLWAAAGLSSSLFRSPDNGDTWDDVPGLHGAIREYGTVDDWAVLDDLLYIGGNEGLGRWNEAELTWDNLSEGLPLHIYKEAYHPAYREYLRDDYPVTNLAVNRGRIFAAVYYHGVYIFNARSETWFPAGLDGLRVSSLISHQSDLYAATKEGIYRASISTVQLYGKAATTWGRVKQGDQATEHGAR